MKEATYKLMKEMTKMGASFPFGVEVCHEFVQLHYEKQTVSTSL